MAPAARSARHSRSHEISPRSRRPSGNSALAQAGELSTDAIVSVDLDGRVQHWSAGAERLFGLSAKDTIGRPLAETGIAIDLTERKAVERERERLATAAEFATDAIISTDLQGIVRHFNEGATRLYGYGAEEVIGQPAVGMSNISAEEFTSSREKVLAGRGLQYEARRTSKDGTVIDVLTTLSPWTEDGEIIGATAVAIDMTERKKLESDLQYLADHDPLTRLYNRRRFTDELERHLRFAARATQPPALVIFDVDQLKTVNDTHGHTTGDALLNAFAGVLRARARARDVVARLGGDEFAMILPEAGHADAPSVAREIRAPPALVGRRRRRPSAPGSSSSTEHDDQITADEMLVCGDSALYEAKEHGGDQARVYSGQADGALTGSSASAPRSPTTASSSTASRSSTCAPDKPLTMNSSCGCSASTTS